MDIRMLQRHNLNTTGKNVYGVTTFKDLNNKQLTHYVSHYATRHVPQITRVYTLTTDHISV